MIDSIRAFFGKVEREDDFSRFFRTAKSSEKKKLLKEVVRKAIADQRATVERAKERTKTKTA
mgnify:FL=1